MTVEGRENIGQSENDSKNSVTLQSAHYNYAQRKLNEQFEIKNTRNASIKSEANDQTCYYEFMIKTTRLSAIQLISPLPFTRLRSGTGTAIIMTEAEL